MVQNLKYYSDNVYLPVGEDHDPTDFEAELGKSRLDDTPHHKTYSFDGSSYGVFYEFNGPVFEEMLLKEKTKGTTLYREYKARFAKIRNL